MLKITVLACGNKMPAWVNEATAEYRKRLQEFAELQVSEIPLLKRSKNNDLARLMEKEAQLILQALPTHARIITLEINGASFSSEKLAHKLETLKQLNSHWCFIIGGPEGLASNILAMSQERWSLSPLTLPHPLARIVLLEALYRAFTITQNHPYHK